MKNIILLLGFIFISINASSQLSRENDPKNNPSLLNKIQVLTINNKSIDFYLKNPKIDKYSKMYYNCEFAPSDDTITFGFLDSTLTNNKETRPFYFFILNEVVKVADGGLAEGISQNCLNYVLKYPCEFTHYVLTDSLVNIEKWQGLLSYSQYFDNNDDKINKIDHYINNTCPKYLNKWKLIREGIPKPDL